MRVINEVIDGLLTREFLDPTDEGAVDAVLADIRRTLGIEPDELGLNREELAGRLVRARRRQEIRPRDRPIQPQDHRRELRRRLDEGARSVGGRILQALGLAPTGVDLLRRMPELAASHNNMGASIRLMHAAVNEAMGFPPKSRRELNTAQLEDAVARLDDFGDSVEAQVRERLGGDARG